jgi:hypothetical protein
MPTRHPLDHPLGLFQPSRIHGIGGFAWVDLRKGQRLIEYIGPKISKAKGLAELKQGHAWIDNEQPLLLGSLTQVCVSTHQVICHASTMQIQCNRELQRV